MLRFSLPAVLVLLATQFLAQSSPGAEPQHPFASPGSVTVLLFVRTDCPITNRYAPELKRIAAEFQTQPVKFWLVYPDKSETMSAIQKHVTAYELPGTAMQDPHQILVKRAQATVSPQAAVFDKAGNLVYSGRIDDRYLDFGKSRPEPSTHDLETAIQSTLAGRPIPNRHTKAIGCYLNDLQ